MGLHLLPTHKLMMHVHIICTHIYTIVSLTHTHKHTHTHTYS